MQLLQLAEATVVHYYTYVATEESGCVPDTSTHDATPTVNTIRWLVIQHSGPSTSLKTSIANDERKEIVIYLSTAITVKFDMDVIPKNAPQKPSSWQPEISEILEVRFCLKVQQ